MGRYIEMDAQAASCTLAVIWRTGRRLKEFSVETNGQDLLGHLADGFILEFGRVSVLALGTPQVGSISASEGFTVPREVQRIAMR